MKVKIERRHIEKGKTGDPEACPISCALKEAFPGATHILTDYKSHPKGREDVPVLRIDDDVLVCKDPQKVVAFMLKFDNDEPVHAFTLEFDDI